MAVIKVNKDVEDLVIEFWIDKKGSVVIIMKVFVGGVV